MMEDIKRGTPEVQEQPTQNVDGSRVDSNTEGQVGFVLDDDGELQVNDSLGFEGGQEAEETEEPQEQEGERPYTLEEMKELGLEKLDPNRIPPELVPFYKSMQADYTRKTQALAEERKVIERILDKALSHPDLAQEFVNDAELVELAKGHPELSAKLQAVSQMAQPQTQANFLDEITEQAKQMVEQMTGEEFDEFNPKHITAMNLATQQLLNQYNQQIVLQQKIAQVASSEPHYEEIDKYAQEKFEELPYREAKKIEDSLVRGNYDVLLKFWEECRKEWYEKHLNSSDKQMSTKPANPPKVENAGTGEVRETKTFDPRKMSDLDDDEQAQALIELGIV